MSQKFYNASIRNLEYRLRKFRDELPEMLEDVVYEVEGVIVSAIANDQLYRRGITGKGVKITSYAPYADRTIAAKQRKGQPTTRVTLRDTGDFHKGMHVVFTNEHPGGFYITSSDSKTEELIDKYGQEIFRLTNENFNRILRVHIRRCLQKRLKNKLKGL